jgi:hypothetical protein
MTINHPNLLNVSTGSDNMVLIRRRMTRIRLLTFAMLFAIAITLSGTPTITTIAASPSFLSFHNNLSS